jgi:hypothetical protein
MTALLALTLFTASPDAAFWGWFQQNEARLADACAQKQLVPTMNEISDKIEALHHGLIGEIAWDPKTKRPTLVVSADGDKKLFGTVKDLVAGAPKLKRWDVRAFRPRMTPDDGIQTLELAGHKFALADFSFRELGAKDGKLDIELYVKGVTDEQLMARAGFLLLDQVLGEYDSEMKIGGIDWKPLPAKPPAGLKPLTDLAKRVDAL